MKTTMIILFLVLVSYQSPVEQSPQTATPEEVVTKVRKAAAHLMKYGKAGFKTLSDPNSEFTWKDTYVFSVNCQADEVMANPAFPKRVGGDIKQHTDYNGKQYGIELCQSAIDHPEGDWIEYTWLKPGGKKPLRKVSFVMAVKGTPYQVGAGIYNEDITLEALRKISNGLD